MRFSLFAFPIVALTLASAAAQTPAPVSVVVHVVDPRGTSVPGATITVQGPKPSGNGEVSATDSSGNVRFALAKGVYKITIFSQGFAPVSMPSFDTAAGVLTVKLRIADTGCNPCSVTREQILIPTVDIKLSALLQEVPIAPFILAPVKFHRSLFWHKR